MKQYFIISLFTLFICSCSEKDNSSSCSELDLDIDVSGNNVYVDTYNSSDAFGFLEIEYGANGFSRGSGTTLSIPDGSFLNNLASGTYDIYARGNCGGSNYSDWVLKSFIIQ